MVKGADVSEFQGTVDWARARAAGIGFAMLRAGYGRGNADARFAANAEACAALSLPIGAYWFGYPLSPADAAREAEYCAAALRPYRVDYPVAYDFEYNSAAWCVKNGVTADRTFVTACAKAFCESVRAAGYTPAVYTNADYAERMFDLDALSDFDLWYAYYQPEPGRETSLWQYTSAGSVPGIPGNADLDIAYRTFGAASAAAGTETAGTAGMGGTFEMTMDILSQGSTGKSVKALQLLLAGYGCPCGGADGVFGPLTLAAVKSYQSENGLAADGCAGPLTWGALLR